MPTLRLHTCAQATLSGRWGCDPGSHTHHTDSSAVQRCAEPSREQTALTVKLDIKVHCTMGQDSCPSPGPLKITLCLQTQWELLYPDKAGFTSCDKHKGKLGRRIRIPKEAQERRQNEQRKKTSGAGEIPQWSRALLTALICFSATTW